MASNDYDVANLALLRIGQTQFITSIDPTVDKSLAAKVAAIAYPQARDQLLNSCAWRFAKKNALLINNGQAAQPDIDAAAGILPGYQYNYTAPADLMQPQGVFNGARPGQPAFPDLATLDAWAFDEPTMLPALDGKAPEIPFEVVGGLLFTDYGVGIPTWDSTATYDAGDPVLYDGAAWTSKESANTNNVPSTGGGSQWTQVSTDPTVSVYCNFVYTAQITDVTQWPPTFVNAVAWRLAVDLALSVAKKPQVVEAIEAKARQARTAALAAEQNGAQRERRPDSKFISVRR